MNLPILQKISAQILAKKVLLCWCQCWFYLWKFFCLANWIEISSTLLW